MENNAICFESAVIFAKLLYNVIIFGLNPYILNKRSAHSWLEEQYIPYRNPAVLESPHQSLSAP